MISENNLIAGIAWHWEDYFSEFPAAYYDCELYLKYADSPTKILTPSKNGNIFVFDVPANNTADYVMAVYSYQYIFTEIETQNKIPLSGVIQIEKLLSLTTDSRSFDQQILDKLKSALLEIASVPVISISMNGKSVQFRDQESIKNLIVFFEARLGINKTKIKRIVASF